MSQPRPSPVGSFLAVTFCLTNFALAELRTWTSTDNQTLEAEFIEGDEESVTIRRTDGR